MANYFLKIGIGFESLGALADAAQKDIQIPEAYQGRGESLDLKLSACCGDLEGCGPYE
jgi:hypothetical protein